MKQLSHIDRNGKARMVNVASKQVTQRVAVARCEVHMQPGTAKLLLAGNMRKGDALALAKVAGIMAAKRTGELIPLAHPLLIEHIQVDYTANVRTGVVQWEGRVETSAKTGVEMEALVAVTHAALTLYDMCKAVDRGITIENIRLIKKTGGHRGTYVRKGEAQ